MKNSSEDRRKINNELNTRSYNQRSKKILKRHTPKELLDKLAIDFYCECSDDSCQARVAMTLDEYEKLHKSQTMFVIAPGHQSPTVEKVTKKQSDKLVVEKYAL
jgi:tRNA isopentenyl-2-thiomethyl-A-37 hydroxylase MiaE